MHSVCPRCFSNRIVIRNPAKKINKEYTCTALVHDVIQTKLKPETQPKKCQRHGTAADNTRSFSVLQMMNLSVKVA